MNKKCGKCSKTVYPTEELKCLDKVWHKACFKCQTCNMTLNMKNYKGYDKFPYCNAHYPTTKHTAVADTPESRRIAQNTKIQSNIKYHEQFEKDKGTKISVADDPETERLKKNMQVVSNVAYHNTLKQRQEQEQNRPMEMTDNLAARNRRNPGSISDYNPPVEASPAASRSAPTHVYNSKGEEYNQPARRQIGSIADYDPMLGKGAPVPGYQPVSPPHHQQQQQQQQQQPRSPALFAPTPYSPPGQFSSKQRQIGSVKAYDPRSNPNQAPGYQYNQPQSQSRPGAPPMYQPFRPQAESNQAENSGEHDGGERPVSETDPTDDKLAESIQILDDLEKSLSGNNLDLDTETEAVSQLHEPSEPPEDKQAPGQFMTTYPIESNDFAQDQGRYTNDYPVERQDVPQDQGRYTDNYPAQTPEEPGVDDAFQTTYPTHPSPPSPTPEEAPVIGNGFRTTYPTEPEPAPQPQKQSKGIISQALYDYAAADTDEVSFAENDIIINCEPVDEGWMYGTVERSGQRGMLPSNYVQRMN